MPDKPPVFLFAFANDENNSLQLGEEQNTCWNELAQLDQAGKINCRRTGFATLTQLYKEFNHFTDQVYVLHYGGHSDKKLLHLHGAAGSAENLGTKIGQQKNLKLVFLNGCRNHDQVDVLFERGVPAVIATTAEVADRRAIALAQQFYQAIAAGSTIRQSFESAKAYLFDQFPALEQTYRGMRLESENGNDFSWGLYAQEEKALDWSIQAIETESQVALLQSLREASRERLEKFKAKGGRFHHLEIKEAILAGVEGIPTNSRALMADNVAVDGRMTSVLEVLPDLWQSETRHALVVGHGGMGKTVSLVRLWEHLLTDQSDTAPVPVFIQLNEYNNRPVKDFIRDYIKAHFTDQDLDALWKQAADRPKVILLLDGFNEVTAQKNELLMEINQLRAVENFPGVQLLLTSRTDDRSIYQWQSFHLLALQALDDEQIKTYLNTDLPRDLRLLEVLRNPMMLSIYAAQSELPKRYLAKGYLKEHVTSTGEMLYNAEAIQRIKIEEQYAMDPSEQAYRRFVLEHLLPYIGWEMVQAGAFSIGEEEKEKAPGLFSLLTKINQEIVNGDFFRIFKDFRKMNKALFQNKEDWELLEELIDGICCTELVLLVKENEEYRFLHQNFRDYFAARHVQNQIEKSLKQGVLPTAMQHGPLDFYVRHLLGELEGEHYNKPVYLLEEKRWSISHFQQRNLLHQLLEKCRGLFDAEQLGYTVWNILTIWKEQRGELSGADLQRLHFGGFSFNGLRSSRPGFPARLSKGALRTESFFSHGHSFVVSSVAYSPDGERIISGSWDHKVKVWDAQSGQYLLTLEGHSNAVWSVAYSPDGRRIISGSSDQMVKVWNAQSGQCLLTLKGHFYLVCSVIYSPDGERIISGSNDRTIKVWEAQSGQCLLTLEGHSDGVSSVAYRPDGECIISGSDDKTVKIWDAQSGQCLLTLEGHSDGVCSVAYSPNGERILSGSSD